METDLFGKTYTLNGVQKTLKEVQDLCRHGGMREHEWLARGGEFFFKWELDQWKKLSQK